MSFLGRSKSFFTFLLSTAAIVDADISKVAGSLPNWQIVAKNLGFGAQEIKDIETSHQGREDRRIAFVREWIMKKGTKATYAKLYMVLEELDEQGAAEKIRDIANEQ